MHDSRQQRILRLLKLRLFSLALLLGVLLLAPAVWGLYSKERESYRNRTVAQTQLVQLQEREQVLSSEVKHLSSERGLEGALRQQFDVGARGEQAIFIVERPALSDPIEEADTNPISRWIDSWWPF